MRKDRFSALEYNFKITQDLSIKLKPKTQSPSDITKYFHVRAPKKSTRYS